MEDNILQWDYVYVITIASFLNDISDIIQHNTYFHICMDSEENDVLLRAYSYTLCKQK